MSKLASTTPLDTNKKLKKNELKQLDVFFFFENF